MSVISKKDFGCLADGRPVFLYTLTNANGTALSICTYGGHVQALRTKDATGLRSTSSWAMTTSKPM